MTDFPTIPEWNPLELAKRLGTCVLVDVRRPDEFNGELSHIEGSQLVTLETDLERFLQSEHERLKEETVVFICRSGVRSMRAALQATQLGYKHPINLRGGMIGWNEAGLATHKTGGNK